MKVVHEVSGEVLYFIAAVLVGIPAMAAGYLVQAWWDGYDAGKRFRRFG